MVRRSATFVVACFSLPLAPLLSSSVANGVDKKKKVVRPCRAGAEHIENLVGQVCESAWASIRLSARTSDRDALSLALLKEVWQPRPHVLICSVFFSLRAGAFHHDSYDDLYTASELSLGKYLTADPT